MDARVVGAALDDDRPEQLASDGARELVRPELIGDTDLLVRDEQKQPQQLRLLRRDRAQDVADRQRIGRRQHGIGGDPPVPLAARGGGKPPVQDLAQHALLDAAHAADLLERLVPAERVGDVAERRHHGLDEADPPRRGLEVEALGMMVDQVFDDRLGRRDSVAPRVGRLAHDLVGVLPVGQPHDAHVLELDARLLGQLLELADEPGQRLHPERAGLLAGRIDVVGQRDPPRVARQQRDLARRQRRAERGHDVVEAGLVGHQRVGVALDDHGLPALADRALGAVDQVQRPALVEQRRRRGVQVLRALALEQPSAEPDRMAVLVADREHDTIAELVVDARAALARRGEADLDELLGTHVALGAELR